MVESLPPETEHYEQTLVVCVWLSVFGGKLFPYVQSNYLFLNIRVLNQLLGTV